MSKQCRRPRVKYTHVDESEAYDKLKDLAQKRRRPYEWDGSSYGKKRAHAPDREALQKHIEVLEVLVQLAPSGCSLFHYSNPHGRPWSTSFLTGVPFQLGFQKSIDLHGRP